MSESGYPGFEDFQDKNNILFVCSCVLCFAQSRQGAKTQKCKSFIQSIPLAFLSHPKTQQQTKNLTITSCTSLNPGHPDMATPRFAIRQNIIVVMQSLP